LSSGADGETDPRAAVDSTEKTPAETPRGEPPNFPEGMAPPPMPKSGNFDNDVYPGDPAADGIGVVVGRSPTAGAYDTNTLTYVPWEDEDQIQPLPVGASLPEESMLLTSKGDDFDLNAAVAAKPTVLIYYRGGWCPALEKLGYQIFAVSTDSVEALSGYENTTDIDYQLLVDPELTFAVKLGIKYKLTQKYIEHVATLPGDRAVDLEKRNGGYLVTPGAFILDTNQTIRFVYVNNNYSVRVSQEALIAAAKAALE